MISGADLGGGGGGLLGLQPPPQIILVAVAGEGSALMFQIRANLG